MQKKSSWLLHFLNLVLRPAGEQTPTSSNHLFDGLLLTPLEGASQAATMGWVITHPKLLLDHQSHALCRPDLSTETEGFSTLLQ